MSEIKDQRMTLLLDILKSNNKEMNYRQLYDEIIKQNKQNLFIMEGTPTPYGIAPSSFYKTMTRLVNEGKIKSYFNNNNEKIFLMNQNYVYQPTNESKDNISKQTISKETKNEKKEAIFFENGENSINVNLKEGEYIKSVKQNNAFFIMENTIAQNSELKTIGKYTKIVVQNGDCGSFTIITNTGREITFIK